MARPEQTLGGETDITDEQIGAANLIVANIGLTAPAMRQENTPNSKTFKELKLYLGKGPDYVKVKAYTDRPGEGGAQYIAYLLLLAGRGGRMPAQAMIEYVPAEDISETWATRGGGTSNWSSARPFEASGDLKGMIKGPMDYLLLSMARDVTLALTDYPKLGARSGLGSQ